MTAQPHAVSAQTTQAPSARAGTATVARAEAGSMPMPRAEAGDPQAGWFPIYLDLYDLPEPIRSRAMRLAWLNEP